MNDFASKFIKKHKEWLERTEEYLDSSDWHLMQIDQNPDENGYVKEGLAVKLTKEKTKMVNNDKTFVVNVASRLKYFIGNTSGEKHLVDNKKIRQKLVDIVYIFLDHCDYYIDNNNLIDIADQDLRNIEIQFQDLVFNTKIKIEDELEGMGALDDYEEVSIIFHKKEKASLIMREPLLLTNPDIKLKCENIQVDWNSATSKELLINMNPKDIPPYNHNKHFFDQETSTIQFWQEEYNKMQNGINLNGYYLHPWLYHHMNIFKTKIPVSKTKEDIICPPVRDNEWFFTENLKVAEEKGDRGLLLYGTRRFSKSTIMASYIEWKLKTKANSVATLTGGNEGDLIDLLDKVDTSMLYSPEAFKLIAQKTDGERTNGTTHLGLKLNAKDLLDFSQMQVKNLSSGQKRASQKTAGGAPSAFVVDEIGKFAFLKSYLAALPSFATPYGYKCVPILSGCVCAGTKVWDNQGNLINIEDLDPNKGILGFSIEDKEVTKEIITYWQPPHKKNCFRITTNTGRNLECSDDHPILFRSRDEKEGHRNNRTRKIYFKEAKDLKVGEQILVAESIPFKGTKKMWNPRLVGLLIGDGSYGYNKGVRFSNADFAINKYVYETTDAVFESGYKTKDGRDYKETRIRGIRPKLRELGIIDQVKDKKTLPKDIHSFREEDICEFLGGLFDADGHIAADGKNYSVNLSAGHKSILIEVQLLLQNLGIHGGIYFSKPNKNNPIDRNGYYKLTIADRRSVLNFKDKIKLLEKSKQDKLEICYSVLKSRKNKIPRELRNVRLERIVSIENLGEKDVYNLTAGNTHTYIANGIITHNTGGEADLSIDAMTVLGNPEGYNLIPMDWDLLESKIDPEQITWKRRTFATFMPGQMGYEVGFKYIDRPFGEFLGIKNATELNKITIKQADFKNNNKVLDNILMEAEKEKGSKGKVLVEQKKVQNPRDPEDCFITIIGNPFPSEEAKLHKKHLIESGDTGRKVFLTKTPSGEIYAESAEDMLLADFPHPGGYIDAPIQLFESLPPSPPPYGLYVAGMDDYKHDQSDGDSVGTLYIYKRQWFDPTSLTLVASYASRPNPRSKFDRQCHYLLQSFNAICFHENEDNNFKTYLDNKHETEIYLAKGLDFSAELNLANNGNRKYGWGATTQNIEFGYSLVKKYLEKEYEVVKEDGTKFTVLGVQRIKDIGLLEEVQNFTKDGNFDRLRGFMGALMYSHYLDSTHNYPTPYVSEEEKERRKKNLATKRKTVKTNPFRSQNKNGYFRG